MTQTELSKISIPIGAEVIVHYNRNEVSSHFIVNHFAKFGGIDGKHIILKVDEQTRRISHNRIQKIEVIEHS